MKCRICRHNEADWAWQPFGPGERPDVFTLSGSHYRGFPVIKVCQKCKEALQAGSPAEFIYRGQRFISNTIDMTSIPDYVSDALLFWETRKEK